MFTVTPVTKKKTVQKSLSSLCIVDFEGTET